MTRDEKQQYDNIMASGDTEALRIFLKHLEERQGANKGHWIGENKGFCSKCGTEGYAKEIWKHCGGIKFCPACGADLQEMEI